MASADTNKMPGNAQRGENEQLEPISCGHCGEQNVKTTMETEEFDYGIPPNVMKIKTVVPVRTCNTCGFQFTDWEAEEIHDAAVAAALYGKTGQ